MSNGDNCAPTKHSNWKIAIAAALGITLGSGIGIYITINAEVTITPKEAREGWAGPDAVEMAKPVVAGMPDFRIPGVKQDNRFSDVRLWKYSKAINDGEHLPNIPQQVGDCVSWGCKNAVDYLQCVQLARGPPAEFKASYAPYFYGISRVQVGGGRLRGDGSVGAWAAEGVRLYGVLASSYEGVPKYSGSIARRWGSKGPPEEFIKEARNFPVKTVSPVRSAEDVRDAICNGYPCTIASNWGGAQDRRLSDKYQRVVFKRSGRWNHQMCLIGYDGSAGEPLFYCLNSWGAGAHPRPTDDAPPGGFWIREQDVEYIVRQGDSFAFSQFKGFPAQELDWNIFGVMHNDQAHHIGDRPGDGHRNGRRTRRRIELANHGAGQQQGL